MHKRWIIAEVDEAAASKLAAALNIHPAVGRILVDRGYGDRTAAESFLNPRISELSDPFDLPNMEEAVATLWNAIEERQRIVIHGDYDVDGVTSTALLARVLSRLGADVDTFIPDRLEDGYGLNPSTVEQCIDQKGAQVIVTVDCGTGSVEAVQRATERGVDVVVTDHHECPGTPAPAVAVVNPKLGNDPDAALLAGVGVTFKLCHALLKIGRLEEREEAGKVDLRYALDLVALGTVADIVPLLGENRALVRYGLQRLSQTAWPGLKALLKSAGVSGEITTYHAGFLLGPRLNAAGRLTQAEQALRLLLSNHRKESEALASALEQANRERQETERKVFEEAQVRAQTLLAEGFDKALVVDGEGWHHGVVGIVASRLSRQFYRPAVVMGIDAEGRARGSCRSIPGFDLLSALTACDEHLLKYGGHKMAAGLELEPDRIPAFREALNREAGKRLTDDLLTPSINIDAELQAGDVDWPLYESMTALRPFGECHAEPVWALRGAKVLGQPKTVGTGHLKLRLVADNRELEAIAFRWGERSLPDGPLDVAFRLMKNEFRGRNDLVMNVVDLQPSGG